jgi:hypothetical protein
VRDFEKGRRVPIGNNLTALRVALENAGVHPLNSPEGKPLGITADTQG